MFHLTFLRWIFWGIVKYVVESLWFDHFTSPHLHVSQICCAVKILTVGSTSPQNSTTPLVSKHALKLQQSRTLYGGCLLLICTYPNHIKHDSLILSSTGSNIDFLIHTHPNPIVSLNSEIHTSLLSYMDMPKPSHTPFLDPLFYWVSRRFPCTCTYSS